MFVGDNPESEKVFIVDQINQKDGSFDEHKVMLGFTNQVQAKNAYRANYDKGWKVGKVTPMNMEDFKTWLNEGGAKKPLWEAVAKASKNSGNSSSFAEQPQHKASEEAANLSSQSKGSISQKAERRKSNDTLDILTATRSSYIKAMAKEKGFKIRPKNFFKKTIEEIEANKKLDKDEQKKQIYEIRRKQKQYENELEKIEKSYEEALDRAYASLSFDEYNERNADTPEALNRQAWQALREEYEAAEGNVALFSRKAPPKAFAPPKGEGEAFRGRLPRMMKSLKSNVAPIKVTSMPQVLQALGVENAPIMIARDVVRKATNGVKHNVPMQAIEQLPEELHDPLAIFESSTEKDAMVILTELKDSSGKPVIIALDLRIVGGEYGVARIASAYGKDNINKWIADSEMLYGSKRAFGFHPPKQASVHETSVLKGLQLPNSVSAAEDSRQILTEDDILSSGKDGVLFNRKLREENNEEQPYTHDLFGNPIQANPRRAKNTNRGRGKEKRDISRQPELRDTKAPDGDYLVRTVLGVERIKDIPVSRIASFGDLAAASQALSDSAVERLDAYVTDKDGNILGIVGGWNGAIAQAQVFPEIVLYEALRLEGAHDVWLTHNHPSGAAELSRADLSLT